jgi:hypothetical protein
MGRHTPGLEVRTHAQRRDERHVALRQRTDRGVVEVVVVIVRDHDRVEGRQGTDRDGHRLKPLRARPLRWGGARTPHGICQYAQSVDLDQYRRMSEPGRAQSAARLPGPASRRIHRRQGRFRHAPITGEQELADGRHRHVRLQQSWERGMHVAKGAAVPERRRLHALPSQPVRLTAK